MIRVANQRYRHQGTFGLKCGLSWNLLFCFSQGKAEVICSHGKDTEAAIRHKNRVELDGEPMKVEIVGWNAAAPSIFYLPTNVQKTQNNAP